MPRWKSHLNVRVAHPVFEQPLLDVGMAMQVRWHMTFFDQSLGLQGDHFATLTVLIGEFIAEVKHLISFGTVEKYVVREVAL